MKTKPPRSFWADLLGDFAFVALLFLLLTLAAFLLSSCGGSAADREFRARVESISARAAQTADGASGEITIHLRDPRGFSK